MKVNLPRNYKDFFTISDLEKAKAVIDCMKGDESKPKDYGKYAVEHALKDSYECLEEVLEAKAEVEPNGRIFDAYGDSGRMDVWMEITARTSDGYVEVSAYLTDIWSIGGDADLRSHMAIRRYHKVD